MNTFATLRKRTTQQTRWLTAGAAALALTCFVSRPQPAYAEHVTPPAVPDDLKVPNGNTAYLVGHATGTQDYICLPSGWTFFGPQATLFKDDEKQIITHFLSANPFESNTPRATWQDSKDTSTVWGFTVASSSDPTFVASGAIPWLLLHVVGAQSKPTGGDNLTATTYIQRLNTSGGVAPSIGCALPTDVGKQALVPYTANYFFFMADKGH